MYTSSSRSPFKNVVSHPFNVVLDQNEQLMAMIILNESFLETREKVS